MIKAFRKSTITCWAVRAAALFIIVFLWIRDKDYPIYIPIIATVLTVGIGYFLSRLLGNIVSSTENTRLLGILHMELDPEKFIEAYRNVPGKIKKGTQDRAITSSYLADAYLANGEPEKALAALDDGFAGVDLEKRCSLRGLYHGNRSAYLIALAEADEAQQESEKLRAVIADCGKNQTLAANLSETLRTRENALLLLRDRHADTGWLKKQISTASYNLRRLELYKLLADDAQLRHDRPELLQYLKKLESEGGSTFYAEYARNIRKEL